MAALTSAGITVHDVWREGGTNSRRFLVKEVTLVLSSQGGLTNNIPATLFGMRKIKYALGFRDTSNDTRYDMIPDKSGSYLVSTTPDAGSVADVSATIKGIVVGTDL
jgi:hypothetical protein